MTKIRYGSVCSGVEAASLAWKPLGWEPAFFAEVEPFPCAVLQQRFNATKPLRPLDPEEAADEKDKAMRKQWLNQINKLPDTGIVPNLGDFTKIKKDDFNGNIDLLVGGTPCQDLSVAGKREGFGNRKDEECATTRSSLAIDFVRLAYELGCRWFVWENVPGVFSSNGGGDFARLLSLFTGCEVGVPQQGFTTSGFVCPDRSDRFGVAWRVLDAQYTRTPGFPFAVPQRRRRVFVIGCLGHWERAAEVLLEPRRVSWNPPARIKARERLAEDTGSRIETASAIRMRAGCEGGGKGALVGDNISHTLQTGNDQTVVEFAEACAGTLEACYYKGVNNWAERTIVSTASSQCFQQNQRNEVRIIGDDGNIAGALAAEPGVHQQNYVFTMDSDRSNAMKSSNPQSGFHESDVAKTLDTTVPTPQKAQGGQMIVGEFLGNQGAKAGSIGYEQECAPTLRCEMQPDVVLSMGGGQNAQMSCIGNNVAQTLSLNNGGLHYIAYENHANDARNKPTDVSPTVLAKWGTGGNNTPLLQSAVAIAENVIGRHEQNGGNGVGAQEELAYTQNATGVMGVCSINCQGGSGVNVQEEATETITAASNSSGNNLLGVCTKGNGDAFVSDVHTSLSASGGGQAGQGYPACVSSSTVRRLLPVECERLMGFPDNHTRIEWNGKPASECPDAPRYKACGNSMCVNCMEWIGIQIQNSEEKQK